MSTCLRYDLYGANLAGEMRHPEAVMRELGITYKDAVPQSLADQWWFLDCSGVTSLPAYITPMGSQDAVRKAKP